MSSEKLPPREPGEDPIRPHVFDGIAEFDKKLPNWWLLTFYGAIVFCIVYWTYYAHSRHTLSDGAEVTAELARMQTQKLSAAAGSSLDDPTLWQMSKNAPFVAAGQATYTAMCASCHLASLKGKDESLAAIGPNLIDAIWLHGGKPTEVLKTIDQGVLAKGMPAWGPVLGPKKISELAAFILSHHQAP